MKRSGGTDWRHPFNVAYQMYPLPEVIFFLTDGKVDNSEETLKLVKTYPDIPIITIGYGLSDQDGIAALAEMSRLTKGSHIALSMQEIEVLYQQLIVDGVLEAK